MKMLAALLLALLPVSAFSEETFVRISLPEKVSVALPKNWTVMTKGQVAKLDEFVQSGLAKHDLYDASHVLDFAANYFVSKESPAYAKFNIRYYQDLELTQQDAKAFSEGEIKELDRVIREGVESSGKVFGTSVIEWRGTERKDLNGVTVFISEYTRTPSHNAGDFCVRLVRIFRGKSSFTITVSYQLERERELRPVCDSIINSIEAR